MQIMQLKCIKRLLTFALLIIITLHGSTRRKGKWSLNRALLARSSNCLQCNHNTNISSRFTLCCNLIQFLLCPRREWECLILCWDGTCQSVCLFLLPRLCIETWWWSITGGPPHYHNFLHFSQSQNTFLDVCQQYKMSVALYCNISVWSSLPEVQVMGRPAQNWL